MILTKLSIYLSQVKQKSIKLLTLSGVDLARRGSNMKCLLQLYQIPIWCDKQIQFLLYNDIFHYQAN